MKPIVKLTSYVRGLSGRYPDILNISKTGRVVFTLGSNIFCTNVLQHNPA